jgi:hypothetical protein
LRVNAAARGEHPMRDVIAEAYRLLKAARAAWTPEIVAERLEAGVYSRLRVEGTPAAIARFYAASPRLLEECLDGGALPDPAGHRPFALVHGTFGERPAAQVIFHALLGETHVVFRDVAYVTDPAVVEVRLLRHRESGDIVGFAIPGSHVPDGDGDTERDRP